MDSLLATVDGTEIGALLTAVFTGGIVAVMLATDLLSRRERRRERAQRDEVKQLFGELMDDLTRSFLYRVSQEDYQDWWLRTMRLTEAALSRGDQHWVMEPIPGGVGIDDTEEKRKTLLKKMHLRIQELMVRLDTMPISPEFDAKKWRLQSGDDT